jgi:outer membrane protein assembly factor BamB
MRSVEPTSGPGWANRPYEAPCRPTGRTLLYLLATATVAVALVVVAVPVAANAGASGDASSLEARVAMTGRVRWRAEAGSQPAVDVVASGRWVLVQLAPATCDGTESPLVVFDAKSGHEVWRASISAGLPHQFAVSGDVVAVLTRGGVVKGLDLAHGTTRWQAPGFQSGIDPGSGTQIFAAGDLFVAERSASAQTQGTPGSRPPATRPPAITLVALERSNGKQRWTYVPADTDQVLGVTFDGHEAIAQTRGPVVSSTPVEPDEKLVGLDLATGAPTWQSALGKWEGFSLIVTANGAVFFTGSTSATESQQLPGAFESGSRLIAVDSSTGAVLWDHRDAPLSPTSKAADDTNLYTINSDGTLAALDARTGTTRWQAASVNHAPNSGPAGTTPDELVAVAAGSGIVVVVPLTKESGNLHALDANTGHNLWATQDPAQTGTIAAGSVYLAGGGTRQNCD